MKTMLYLNIFRTKITVRKWGPPRGTWGGTFSLVPLKKNRHFPLFPKIKILIFVMFPLPQNCLCSVPFSFLLLLFPWNKWPYSPVPQNPWEGLGNCLKISQHTSCIKTWSPASRNHYNNFLILEVQVIGFVASVIKNQWWKYFIIKAEKQIIIIIKKKSWRNFNRHATRFYTQELEIRSEMHVKMAKSDYTIRRADSPYMTVHLVHFNMHFLSNFKLLWFHTYQ